MSYPKFVFWLCLFAWPLWLSGESDEDRQHVFQELRSGLEDAPLREISFQEFRYFPFRLRPVELDGVVRLWAGEALSVAYPEKANAILLDGEGVWMRQWTEEGQVREKRARDEAAEMADMLRSIFEFDAERLGEDFDISVERAPETGRWTLHLNPREAAAGRFEAIQVDGRGRQVSRIELDFGGGRRIEIVPVEEKTRASFSKAELERYFRVEE